MENRVNNIGDNIFTLILGLFFLSGSTQSFSIDEISFLTVLEIIFVLSGLYFTFFALFCSPWYYIFDINGISLCCLFGRRQRFLWKNINSVLCVERSNRGGTYYEYQIIGTPENKPRFHMQNTVSANKKTKRFFEEYFACGIIDFPKEAGFKKSKSNDGYEKYISDYASDTRNQIEKYVAHYHSELAEMGLCLNVRYAYFLKGCDEREYSARPEGNSLYTAVFEVSRPYETDRNRIFQLVNVLIYFKAGKKRAEIIDNETVIDLLAELDKSIEKIKQVGIDKYLEE